MVFPVQSRARRCAFVGLVLPRAGAHVEAHLSVRGARLIQDLGESGNKPIMVNLVVHGRFMDVYIYI